MGKCKTISNIEWKLREADFFLEKMRQIEHYEIQPYDFFAYNCYFNAFATAARTVTLTIQYVMAETKGFAVWYEKEQEKLSQNPLAKKLLTYRNDIVHKGDFFVRSGSMRHTEGQGIRFCHFFFNLEGASLDNDADTVYSLAWNYMTLLVALAARLYTDFGTEVDLLDPDRFYTPENLVAKGHTIEDVEYGLGLPRGWTVTEGVSPEERLKLLLERIPKPEVKELFRKYAVAT